MQGLVWKFGDDIDTDAIIPARYLNTSDPQAKHVMEMQIRLSRKSAARSHHCGVKELAGSPREHAPLAIKAAGISSVIAHSFARIFYRNAINIGLPILECPEAAEKIAAGDEVRVDLNSGTIYNLTKDETYQAAPFPSFMQDIMDKGGLIGYVQWRLQQQ